MSSDISSSFFICISLNISNCEHFVLCDWPAYIFFWEMSVHLPFPFFNGYCFLLLRFLSANLAMDISYLSDKLCANISTI